MNVMTRFEVVQFSSPHQKAVESLVLPIQQSEFGVQVSLEGQPDLMDIACFFQHGNGNFWIVKQGEEVIGSVGLVDIGDGQVTLRKMFVRKDFRGKQFGVAQALLDTALAWCKTRAIWSISLGTTHAYLAAHRFYEKNGFVEVDVTALPSSFPRMPVDQKFYMLNRDSTAEPKTIGS